MCLGSGVYKSCLFSSMSSGLLVIPGVSTLPCLPLMLSLKTIILKYVLVCVFLISPCCVHRNRRPDQNSKRRPFTSFCFVRFFKSLVCSCVLSLWALMPAVRGSLCRRSRLSHPAVRGSLRRRSRLSHPAVRGTSCRRSRLSDPAVRGSWRRRSRLCHPAVRGSSRRRLRIIQPSVPGGWRLHPRLTLARRPASDSMPAGLPLTQCPPACLWLNARRPASDSSSPGVPLTQARRIAADSSSPDCRWLKLAGLPLTHATGRRQGRPTHHLSVSRRRPRPTSSVAGKANPPSAVHSARSRLRLPPARRPLPLCGQARRLLPLFVKPADYGIPRRPLPYWQASRPWPYLTRQWPRSF